MGIRCVEWFIAFNTAGGDDGSNWKQAHSFCTAGVEQLEYCDRQPPGGLPPRPIGVCPNAFYASGLIPKTVVALLVLVMGESERERGERGSYMYAGK